MKILIVDDDVFNVTLISDILSPLGTCDAAGNGAEAIALFDKAISEENPYDLICLDIIMPGMDGRQVLSRSAPPRTGGKLPCLTRLKSS